MRTTLIRLASLALMLCAMPLQAAPAYVIDKLEITLRTGASTTHSIVRMLDSGTRVDVLETDPESGYSRVNTPDGKEGYVLSRFLDAEPIARDKLTQARRRLEMLDAQKQRLEGEIATLKTSFQELESDRDQLRRENETLTSDLEQIRRTSSEALQIAADNAALKKRVAEADRIVEDLRAENAGLQDNTAQRWFIIGGGVIVVGMLLGLVLPRVRWRRRTSWGEL